MAESSSEKTEMPTSKKLRDARNKGQVCSSKEIISTAILIGLFCLVALLGQLLIIDFNTLINVIADNLREETTTVFYSSIKLTALIICKHSFIFVFVAACIGVIGNVAQIGFLFTFEPLKPSFEKINPAEGVKKIVSKKNLFEFLKNIAKVVFLSYLIYKLILASIPEMLAMCYGNISNITPCLCVILTRLAWYTAFGYILIAIIDRIFQGKNFLKQMMMTKDEVKREYKEMEGSSEIKQAQREFRNEILNGPDPVKATRKASVIVTNPTHLSIGIRYCIEEAPLPKIVVAGADQQAKIIRETALAEGIPLFENVPLAHALWENGQIEMFIPENLIEPVAEILKQVKELEKAREEDAELDAINLN